MNKKFIEWLSKRKDHATKRALENKPRKGTEESLTYHGGYHTGYWVGLETGYDNVLTKLENNEEENNVVVIIKKAIDALKSSRLSLSVHPDCTEDSEFEGFASKNLEAEEELINYLKDNNLL